MPTHGCIGNPCWICFPEYAPRFEPVENIDLLPIAYLEPRISDPLKNLLINTFAKGLDEDGHIRNMGPNLNLEKIKIERSQISSDSLVAKLLDLMIEFMEG